LCIYHSHETDRSKHARSVYAPTRQNNEEATALQPTTRNSTYPLRDDKRAYVTWAVVTTEAEQTGQSAEVEYDHTASVSEQIRRLQENTTPCVPSLPFIPVSLSLNWPFAPALPFINLYEHFPFLLQCRSRPFHCPNMNVRYREQVMKLLITVLVSCVLSPVPCPSIHLRCFCKKPNLMH
jgi:hypothetical protein